MRGFGRIYRRGRSPFYWIEYWYRGRQYRESSGSARETDALRLLKKRLQDTGRGRFVGPSEERVLVTDLLAAVEADYQVNGWRSLTKLRSRLTALRAAFAGMRALDVTEDRIERYRSARAAEGLAPATINRELAVLRRGFRLAVRQRRLSTMPTITLAAEHNARQGFCEPSTFDIISGRLPDDLRDFAGFAYLAGWRKGEIATLAWLDVDRARGLITLRRERSKNEEPRVLPLTPELAKIIERRWQARRVVRPDGTTILADLVFHRRGAAVKNFRKAWARACTAAGVPQLLFHDLRRSAVRNMESSGVPRSVAMKLSGHKTESVYRRYRIVDETDLREAMTRVEAHVASDRARTVVPIAEARRG
jgi:integrase